jgi:hypothetical protein
MCVCLSVCLSVLSVTHARMSVCLSVCLFVSLCLSLSLCLSCSNVFLSICLSLSLSLAPMYVNLSYCVSLSLANSFSISLSKISEYELVNISNIRLKYYAILSITPFNDVQLSTVLVDSSNSCNMLNFQMGNTAIGTTLATRSWNIKVIIFLR